jgi:hypothetical protein
MDRAKPSSRRLQSMAMLVARVAHNFNSAAVQQQHCIVHVAMATAMQYTRRALEPDAAARLRAETARQQ